MQWTQHKNFKGRLFAVLFLFFNCICAATPILKLANADQETAVSTRSLQVPNPSENEEENHSTVSGYINHVSRFSVGKHCDKLVCNSLSVNPAILLPGIDLPKVYTSDDSVLPTPGADAFLFRYNLF